MSFVHKEDEKNETWVLLLLKVRVLMESLHQDIFLVISMTT